MKRELKKIVPLLILSLLAIWVFRAWFTSKTVSAGDWGFLYPEAIHSFAFTPFSWFSSRGLGANSLPTLWIGSYYQSTAFLFNQTLKIPWLVAEKIIWFLPFLILTIFSSWYLAETLFPKNKIAHFFAPFIFLFNTYILMVVGGGQMGVAMAYSLAPLVFSIFAKTAQSPNIRLKLIAGLILALQVMFDPRISFLTMGAVFLYAIFRYGLAIRKYLETFTFPFFISLGLHFYWLLPLILTKRATLPAGLGEPGWVEFLSFGNFSDSISLLHPNWPENIFGKTYFMRPEFLVVPILAFSSLLFISQLKTLRAKKNILFLTSLGLISAFLAKGSKPPFGGVYLWLFKNFPGMNMFRDPTKFYLFVALSYSILIPFSLVQISRRLRKVSSIKYLVLGIFVLCWLFLIRPAWLGQLGGTFKAKEVPPEYVVLKDFIHNQEEFFRTFWAPKRQRFGFYSNNHPAVESSELLSEEELAVIGVKYVIIPYDSEGEIFLEDRKYDPTQRLALEEKLDNVSWLKKIEVPDKIAVYETPNYKDHFFIAYERGPPVDWKMVNPTKYLVRVQNASQPFKLIFSETYDELWQAKIGGKISPSTMFNDLNSFSIDQTGDFEITVEFAAQKYVVYGLAISVATLLVSVGLIVYPIKLGKIDFPF